MKIPYEFQGMVPTNKEWKKIMQSDTPPQVNTVRRFVEELSQGIKWAKRFLTYSEKGPSFETKDIMQLHQCLFKNIFSTAGRLRELQFYDDIGTFSSSDAIEAALNSLRNNSKRWFTKDDPILLAVQIAAYHIQFYCIKPFAYGSDEVAGLILAHQSEQLLGERVYPGFFLSQYHAARTTAMHGCITPLALLILRLTSRAPLYRWSYDEVSIKSSVCGLRELGNGSNETFWKY